MDLHIPATRNELPRLRQFAESFCTQLRPSWRDDMSAGLAIVALHEAACNVIEHGYRDRPGQSIDLIACGDHDSYEFVLIDSAPEFNPQHRTRPALDGSHERGFGVYMMHACFDRVRYMRRHAQNCLRLSRRWDRTPAAVRRFETALASITIALD